MSRLRDTVRTSSLNNLLPEDQLSDMETSGLYTHNEQTNGLENQTSHDGSVNGASAQPKNQLVTQISRKHSANEESVQHEMADSYEVTV